MKKLLILLTVLTIALSGALTSCSDKDDLTPEATEDTNGTDNGDETGDENTGDDEDDNTGDEGDDNDDNTGDEGDDNDDNTGDDDDDDDTYVDTTPTITWDANPNFYPYDLSVNVNAKLTVDVPNGIETFTFKISTDNTTLNEQLGLAGVSVDTSLDLINGSSVDALKALGIDCGKDLYGATSVEFDLTDFVTSLPEMVNGASFTATIDLSVSDPENQTAGRTLTFYEESTVPTITWEANPDFEEYDLNADDIDVTIVVDAPLGIENFTISINTSSFVLNIGLAALGISTNTEYDIIFGDVVGTLQSIGINCGESLYGATHVELNLTSLAELLPTFNISFTGTISLTVSDPKEQTVSKTISIKV